MNGTGPSFMDPIQALRVALRELYLRAGEPSMRAIATACGPGVISHNTVHKVIKDPHAAAQRHVAIVVGQLGGEVESFRDMWVTARLALGDEISQLPEQPPAPGGVARMACADELFLLSHYPRDGRSAVSRESLGIALAGAVLSELLVQRCIAVSSGKVTVLGSSARDRVGTAFLQRIQAMGGTGTVTTDALARQLRLDAISLVSQRLADAGLIVPERVRRFGGWRDETRYPHTSNPQAKEPTISMRGQVLADSPPADQQTALLAALILVISAYRTLPLDLPEPQVRERLAALAAPLRHELRSIVAAVDTAVAKNAVTPNI